MRKRSKRTRPIRQFLVISTCVVLFGVLALSFMGRKELTLPHRLIFDILGTVQSGVTGIINYGLDIRNDYIDLIGVKKENARLREEIKRH
ncbi:MAG: hypothetical protein LC633_03915, partial [Desulfobulbaceae bacterium]|nr:hypothetical protein [Desulfobulbaceae bacterium]